MAAEPPPEEISRFGERVPGGDAKSGGTTLFGRGGGPTSRVPTMSARVMGAMLVSPDGTRTAAELADLLKISQPAVSGAVRQLLQVAFISRVRLPGSAKAHYRVPEGRFA